VCGGRYGQLDKTKTMKATPHAGPASAVMSPRCIRSGRDVGYGRLRRVSGTIYADTPVRSVGCRPQTDRGGGVLTSHPGPRGEEYTSAGEFRDSPHERGTDRVGVPYAEREAPRRGSREAT
jgi:hypothetical protein